MNNLRYAFRQLRKAPAFTFTALATVAICLGANLAIFAVIDSVLLRPLPFPKADQLVTIFNTYPKAGVERDGSSLTNYYERRGNIPPFSSLSIFRYGSEVVGETGSTQQEEILRVSPEFFTTLSLGPVMGPHTLGCSGNHPRMPGVDSIVTLQSKCFPNQKLTSTTT